jgi:heme/copper-type cytochrome/quinol oxidase subunit 4
MSDTTAPAPATSSAEDVEAFNRHLKGYLFVGGLQVLFTIIAVILSFVIVGTSAKIIAVLLAASINAAIVAGIQMHLKGEKAIIWRFLFFTGIFFFVLFFLSLFHWFDPITGSNIHH